MFGLNHSASLLLYEAIAIVVGVVPIWIAVRNQKDWPLLYGFFALIVAAAATVSIKYTWDWRAGLCPEQAKNIKPDLNSPAIHLLFWLLAPPLWFVVEYWWIHEGGKRITDMERFKMSQDLATKFWAAVAVVLGVLYKVG